MEIQGINDAVSGTWNGAQFFENIGLAAATSLLTMGMGAGLQGVEGVTSATITSTEQLVNNMATTLVVGTLTSAASQAINSDGSVNWANAAETGAISAAEAGAFIEVGNLTHAHFGTGVNDLNQTPDQWFGTTNYALNVIEHAAIGAGGGALTALINGQDVALGAETGAAGAAASAAASPLIYDLTGGVKLAQDQNGNYYNANPYLGPIGSALSQAVGSAAALAITGGNPALNGMVYTAGGIAASGWINNYLGQTQRDAKDQADADAIDLADIMAMDLCDFDDSACVTDLENEMVAEADAPFNAQSAKQDAMLVQSRISTGDDLGYNAQVGLGLPAPSSDPQDQQEYQNDLIDASQTNVNSAKAVGKAMGTVALGLGAAAAGAGSVAWLSDIVGDELLASGGTVSFSSPAVVTSVIGNYAASHIGAVATVVSITTVALNLLTYDPNTQSLSNLAASTVVDLGTLLIPGPAKSFFSGYIGDNLINKVFPPPTPAK